QRIDLQVDKDKTPLRTPVKVSKESPDMKNDKASGSDKKVHEESAKNALELMLFKTSRKYAKGLLLVVEELELLVQINAVRRN
nr:hypothetical protein [Tanacetum cinerariifolium]